MIGILLIGFALIAIGFKLRKAGDLKVSKTFIIGGLIICILGILKSFMFG